MNPLQALQQVYEQVAREFRAKTDILVRRTASRQRILELFGPVQQEAGWSDDSVFDTIVNQRKRRLLRSLYDLYSSDN